MPLWYKTLKSGRKTANINTTKLRSFITVFLVSFSTPLGRGCNRSHILHPRPTAQWSTRRNQIFFAVLDVSMSLNNGP